MPRFFFREDFLSFLAFRFLQLSLLRLPSSLLHSLGKPMPVGKGWAGAASLVLGRDESGAASLCAASSKSARSPRQQYQNSPFRVLLSCASTGVNKQSGVAIYHNNSFAAAQQASTEGLRKITRRCLFAVQRRTKAIEKQSLQVLTNERSATSIIKRIFQ